MFRMVLNIFEITFFHWLNQRTEPQAQQKKKEPRRKEITNKEYISGVSSLTRNRKRERVHNEYMYKSTAK